MVYPYTKFQSIEDIRACVQFPPIEDFLTDKSIDPRIYEKCKSMFVQKMALPEEHPEKWRNFEDYLKFYNLSDVGPTSLALMRQFDIFKVCVINP